MTTGDDNRAAVAWVDARWDDLTASRLVQLRRFLRWVAATEERGGRAAVRLRDRDDLRAIAEVLAVGSFTATWWALCVYTTVDSLPGAVWLAQFVPEPVEATEADRAVPSSAVWPNGLIGSHRAQASGKRGARECLLSMCRHRDAIADIVCGMSSVEDAVRRLLGLRARQVGRTTAFDLALRAGQFLHVPPVEPRVAQLHAATGPAAGFEQVFGFDPSGSEAAKGEEVLRRWHERWTVVTEQAAVPWLWEPLSVGDLENALCIYQDRRSHARFGHPDGASARP